MCGGLRGCDCGGDYGCSCCGSYYCSRFRLVYIFIFFLLFILYPDTSAASVDKEEAINHIISIYEEYLEKDNDGDAVYSDLIEKLSDFLYQVAETPLNINTATESDLEKFCILSDYQIISILDYRNQHGDILSLAELSLLNGFDYNSALLLKPFISFGSDRLLNNNNSEIKRLNHELYIRGNRILEQQEWYKPISDDEYDKNPNSRYLGSPYYYALKYKLNYSNTIKFGLTMEKDAGETISLTRPADFISGYIFVDNINFLKNNKISFIVGDFSARFGQGLTIWNSFNISGVQNPIGFYKRGSSIMPYSSTSETNFLRGVAIAFVRGGAEISFITSYKGIDASLIWSEESQSYKYTSINISGLHNTKSTLDNKNSMREMVFGANASYSIFNGNGMVGLSWVTQQFSKQCGKTIKEYNKYQLYDGYCGSIGVNYKFLIRRIIFFGEIAINYNESLAGLLGARLPINSKIEAGLLLRKYSKRYISPYAGAYSTSTGCYNQEGVALNILYQINGFWKASANADVTHFPWLRYNVNRASTIYKFWIRADYSNYINSFYTKVTYKYSDYDNKYYLRFKYLFNRKIAESFSLKIQNEYIYSSSKFGLDAALDFSLYLSKNRINIIGRFSYFNCKEWETRLYLYENDMPQSYSSQMLYGTGIKGYIIANIKILKKLNLYLKSESLRYFKESDKEPVSKIKLGLKLKI